ncbi:mitochondrial outer membrane protein SLC25A46-like [Ornithodoros turicata]|uniref:mitochondrial outer membrane protein SLC25A46-like n=1 Tax=Ornithodoros turicata TaxID=34597 RepID=UPI003139CEC3
MAGVHQNNYGREGDYLQPIPELTVGPNIRARGHYDFSQLPPAVLAEGDANRPNPKEIDQEPQYAGVGLRLMSILAENVISHPCVVLRRQCQVNCQAHKFHLSPFTLLPVIAKLQQRQGLITLWKGAPSVFIVRGLTMAMETCLSEVMLLPREVTSQSSLKHMAKHVALKGATFALITPFYCASLVEVVQCDMASEKPGVLDCLREGLCRMVGGHGRMLPIWKLVGPTVVHGVLHYILSSVVQSVVLWWSNVRERQRMGAVPRVTHSYFPELMAAFTGSLIADVVLFPLETVLHRLYLQGTRTIIDNLDTGCSVAPVISQYLGPVDCFQSIIIQEGAAGLYKGFGALILQYSIHCALLKLTRIAWDEFFPA